MHVLNIISTQGLGLGLGADGKLAIERDGATRTEAWTLDAGLDRLSCILQADGLEWLADATEIIVTK